MAVAARNRKVLRRLTKRQVSGRATGRQAQHMPVGPGGQQLAFRVPPNQTVWFPRANLLRAVECPTLGHPQVSGGIVLHDRKRLPVVRDTKAASAVIGRIIREAANFSSRIAEKPDL